jgi:hypothetical protein
MRRNMRGESGRKENKERRQIRMRRNMRGESGRKE